MKKFFVFLPVVISLVSVHAQKKCYSYEYMVQESGRDPLVKSRMEEIELFSRQSVLDRPSIQRTQAVQKIIKVPVVFHVLYHTPDENISTEKIIAQLNSLNRDFRRKNRDTVNTPQIFLPLAADMGIEFYMAKSDPAGRSTAGIIRKYTPVKYWFSDDKMKYTTLYGDDAWDSKSYLNIWICRMEDVLGYAALPGSDLAKDGIVLAYSNFNDNGTMYNNLGRTLVHEVGHWLNLKHIWGDNFCGDDDVDDTPKQSTYTPGCPSGTRISCGSTLAGDMYMNYMDFTEDGCMNLFTEGQKIRARKLFETGGYRNSILSSKAFNAPGEIAASLPDFYPQWLEVKIYPNPATSILSIYLEYDERWKGKEFQVIDMSGKVVARKTITSVIQQMDISRLVPGIYFIRSEKEGENIYKKFVKL
jgi:hypothetical protein